MRMKTRLFAMLLCLTAVLPALFGCDGGTDPGKETGSVTEKETEAGTEASTEPAEIKYTGYKLPGVVETHFTKEVVVADAVATDRPYSADPTGEKDCSAALNKAIKAVYDNGGGTVFLPAGTYRLENTVEVLPFVSLVGDFSEKCDGSEGTVILACVPSSDEKQPGLFRIGGSAGVVGLTVYYPEQDIGSVKPYPYTFEIPGSAAGAEYYMLSTIENCVVLNGYRGIYAGSVNEQMIIKNVRGTFLKTAFELYDSADASSIARIEATPDYWANCALGSADRKKIASYTEKSSEAFVIGDLEWASFSDLTCDSYMTGIHVVKGPRAVFSGMIYRPILKNTALGIVVDDIDARTGYGIGVTGGEIDAYEFAVVNNTKGKVQLTGTVTNADLSGSVTVNREEPDSYPSWEAAAPQPKTDFSAVKAVDPAANYDVSARLQKTLDEMGEKGGGIVYLPAGFYLLENPVNVPDNVELRGAGYVGIRDQMSLSLGTIIFSKVDLKNSDTAAVTLGKGSGLRNVNLVQSLYNNLDEYLKNGKFAPTEYLVRLDGDGGYVRNCAMSGVRNAIDVHYSNHYYISGLSLNAYQYGVHVSGSDHGYVGFVLTNVTVGFRNRFWGLSNLKSLFPEGQDKNFETSLKDEDEYNTVNMMMDNYTELYYEGCEDAICEYIFSYGALHTIHCFDSRVKGLNIGKDCNWLYPVHTPMIVAEEDSELQIWNMTRFNGKSCKADDTSLVEIYTRVTINENEDNLVILP